jgi:hypothetical protein
MVVENQPVFSTGENFACMKPLETFGDILIVAVQWEVFLTASSKQKAELLLNILQCTAKDFPV